MRHIESPSTRTAASVLLAVSVVLSAVACGRASETVPVEGLDSGPAVEHESSALFSAGRGIEPVEVDRDSFQFVAASISDDLYGDAAGTAWSLSVRFDLSEDTAASGDAEARGSVTLLDQSGKGLEFPIRLAPVAQTLHFPAGAVGFVPHFLEVRVTPPGRITRIDLEPGVFDLRGPPDEIVPIPADPGVILRYDRAAWRQRRYELFRWNLVSDVLVFEFADYATQRSFFARLAFFVGVTGESGRIEPEPYYEGRHVFNAHDYRPEDIAAFFTLAGERSIELNADERLFRDIALRNDIIIEEGAAITPGRGAVLGIASETPGYLRKRLLTHEAMHGLFYAAPELREGVFRLHSEMPEHEKLFWTVFLANKGVLDGRAGYDGYDVANEYLLVNEILGHMMQLLPHEVEPYFLDTYLTRMERRFPGEAALFRRIRADDPAPFVRARASLERLLGDTLGLVRGDIYMTGSPIVVGSAE